MISQIILTSLLISGIAASDSTQLVEPTSKDNAPGCECFLVSGPDPGYFQYHRFWDFRNISSQAVGSNFNPPALIIASENQGGQDTTSAYFNTSEFLADWSIQNTVLSPTAAVPSVNSAQNVYIAKDIDGGNSTYLAIRASRLDSFASSTEVDSNQKNVLHSSMRARMRVIPNFYNTTSPFVDNGIKIASIPGLNNSHPVAPGAVLGLFTFESDTQESDIEILTYDPLTNIRYSNQPDYDAKTDSTVPGASTDAVMPSGDIWTEWHDHRIDWYGGISRWYVDGQLVLQKTLNVPTKPSGLIFNLWSDGGEWSGNMSVGSQVVAGIEYIEMVFNVSGSNPQKRKEQSSCQIGCNVDSIPDVGFPQVLYNVTSSGAQALHDLAQGQTTWALLVVFWSTLAYCGLRII